MLEFSHLHKRFGDLAAVEDVSLRIEGGEFFCLLGPSGCGKSTLLRMIAGFEEPDSGTILLKGQDITRLPPYKRDLNMVFQNYALFPGQDVAGNVSYGLRIRRLPAGEIQDRVSQALAQVGLTGLEARLPSQLSGGQRQRVALARALVMEPSMLLLDEPMSALDKKISEQMRRELKDLQQRVGISFILVTHNQTEALALADRIAVMNQGRIEQAGSSREVYEQPATRFTAAFIGSMNDFPAVIEETTDAESRILLFGRHPVQLSAPSQIKAGEEVRFCIRPERLRLSMLPPQPYENGIQGQVTGAVFQGETTLYDIRTEEGTELSVQVQNYLSAMGEGFYGVDDPVHVVWSRTSGCVFHV